MKIALVHDFLKEYGGAERVLEVLHEIWPNAPIFTSFIDPEGLGPHWERIKKWHVITSWAQKIPYISQIYSPLRFLAPYFFESFDFSDFDVVITSTNAYYAKGIITRPETTHFCYCHTPPRSLYGYPTRMNWRKNVFTRIYGYLINHLLREYDFLAAQRVNYFIANSEEVKKRIEKFYRRDSLVIYPPVDLAVSHSQSAINKYNKNKEAKSQEPIANSYYLYVGKLAAAKNVYLAIEAVKDLGFRLKIVGKGGEEDSLRKIANLNIEFLGEVDDKQLVELYKNCLAVIFPAADEDFGIVPVEAMSFGKPIIAFKNGGVVETVINGKTGVFFTQPTVESLVGGIKKLNKLKINPDECKKQAGKFSKKVFVKKMKELVENYL
ncbi:glycosyltransferase [Candidatus Microgenomates bacterium]|nr:glycosyltransferase [Candidatus Microgenomates bacterium]